MKEEWIKFEDKLPTNILGEQVNILFCSPGWATYIRGMYDHNEDLLIKERLSSYNQEIDRYVEWLSKMPTHWFKLPDKPEK